jgi:hypothetical protein
LFKEINTHRLRHRLRYLLHHQHRYNT